MSHVMKLPLRRKWDVEYLRFLDVEQKSEGDAMLFGPQKERRSLMWGKRRLTYFCWYISSSHRKRSGIISL